jgi:hypothetical protein
MDSLIDKVETKVAREATQQSIPVAPTHDPKPKAGTPTKTSDEKADDLMAMTPKSFNKSFKNYLKRSNTYALFNCA